MAVTAFIKYDEMGVGSPIEPEADIPYLATGSEVGADIRKWFNTPGNVPSTYGGLWLQKFTIKHVGNGIWDCSVHYGRIQPVLPGTMVFKGETTGKTIHREQSIKTVNSYSALSAGRRAPDFKTLIGVSRDAVAGVDVVTPSFRFTMQDKYVAGTIPNNYIQAMIDLTATVNLTPVTTIWKGQILTFQAGEILYLGGSVDEAEADPNGLQQMQINHQFEFSQNQTNLTVGTISNIVKNGWDYLWVLRQAAADVNNYRIFKIVAVYVEQVYNYGTFDVLNIGQGQQP